MKQFISAQILKACGWQLDRRLPAEKKYIIIGAPHTSNWDFPLAILALYALGLRFSWVGKHTLFRFPFGYVFRALGGIPVDRHIRQSFITKMISLFASSGELILAIAPEGTRAKTSHWKTGFHVIAREAAIPIALGYLDYRDKKIGVGATLYPSPRIEDDFLVLQQFYAGKIGKYPAQQGPVQLRQKEMDRYRQQQDIFHADKDTSAESNQHELKPPRKMPSDT